MPFANPFADAGGNMFIDRHASSLLLIAALLATASPARAQSPPVVTYADSHAFAEVVGSVTFQRPPYINQSPLCQRLSVPCLGPKAALDPGLVLTTTVLRTDRIGVVGEFGTYSSSWYSNGTDCSYSGCIVDQHEQVTSLLGGLRLRTGPVRIQSTDPPTRLFVQVLAGPEWSTLAPLHPVVQPGIGTEWPLRDNFGFVHVEYDYRFAPTPGRSLSTHRFLIGLGVSIGRL
jgi:hypothetical protein